MSCHQRPGPCSSHVMREVASGALLSERPSSHVGQSGFNFLSRLRAQLIEAQDISARFQASTTSGGRTFIGYVVAGHEAQYPELLQIPR